MTIRNQNEPPGGRDIVNAALRARSPRTANLMALGGAAAQTGRALPIYILTLEDASAADPLALAKLTGWRYPIVGGELPGLASLAQGPDQPQYAGITHGLLPQRLLEAAKLAEETLASSSESYEPRLLDAPALRIYCLWLAGASNYFISLMDGQPPGTSDLRIEDDIVARIRAALAARTSHLRQVDGSPTN